MSFLGKVTSKSDDTLPVSGDLESQRKPFDLLDSRKHTFALRMPCKKDFALSQSLVISFSIYLKGNL